MADELDDLASFLQEEDDSQGVESDEDLLASFLNEEEETEEDEDVLSSFFGPEPEEENEEEDVLSSFFGPEPEEEPVPEPEVVEEEEEDLLSSFFSEDKDNTSSEETATEEEEEEEDAGGILGDLLGSSNQKPDPILPYKKEKRKARLDITKNSKSDHRDIKRYTKSELNDQLKRDYKYMLSKPYMMIQPVTIMADYPYKKKKSDDDSIKSYNTDLDYVLVIGKLLKWRSTEEFKGKPYKLGEIMYVKRGIYWVAGKKLAMEPHFAIVLNRSYKRIKTKRIRDMLAPLKQRLRSGKPFSIYKEFPIIVERTGAYS
ncbi:MAG: hypothetical protein ACRBFS_16795 [Aureispira sp.]